MASCGCSILHAWRASQTRQPGRQGSWVHDLQTGLVKGWHNKICNLEWSKRTATFQGGWNHQYTFSTSPRLPLKFRFSSYLQHAKPWHMRQWNPSLGLLWHFRSGAGCYLLRRLDELSLRARGLPWSEPLVPTSCKTPMIELLTTSGFQKSVASHQCLRWPNQEAVLVGGYVQSYWGWLLVCPAIWLSTAFLGAFNCSQLSIAYWIKPY